MRRPAGSRLSRNPSPYARRHHFDISSMHNCATASPSSLLPDAPIVAAPLRRLRLVLRPSSSKPSLPCPRARAEASPAEVFFYQRQIQSSQIGSLSLKRGRVIRMDCHFAYSRSHLSRSSVQCGRSMPVGEKQPWTPQTKPLACDFLTALCVLPHCVPARPTLFLPRHSLKKAPQALHENTRIFDKSSRTAQ